MFGHQDDQPAADANNPAGGQPANDATTSTDPDDQPSGQPPQSTPPVPPDLETSEPAAATPPSPTPTPDPAPADNTAAPAPTQAWQHPGTPVDGNKDANDAISPAGGYPMRPTYQYAAGATSTADKTDNVTTKDADLIEIKDKALDELSPLIDKLDLSPEEKFRTLMMMIQASDNDNLVKDAYTSAHAIEDEKVRAQALLDIINEVNYFTSPHDDKPEEAAAI